MTEVKKLSEELRDLHHELTMERYSVPLAYYDAVVSIWASKVFRLIEKATKLEQVISEVQDIAYGIGDCQNRLRQIREAIRRTRSRK
jgi:hypothetical protein